MRLLVKPKIHDAYGDSRKHDESNRVRRSTLVDVTSSHGDRRDAPDSNSSADKMGKQKRLLDAVDKPDRIVSTAAKHANSWTAEEDEALRYAVGTHSARNWKLIAEALPNRTDVQCLHRWQKVLNPILVKGYWTDEEDDRMLELVEMFGLKRWAALARCLPGRNGKQCRERWCNHLDPKIKRHAWTEEEDMMLFVAHQHFGNKWAEISKLLPGRPDNSVKNRWNTAVKKKGKDMQERSTLFNAQNPEIIPAGTHVDCTADVDGEADLSNPDDGEADLS